VKKEEKEKEKKEKKERKKKIFPELLLINLMLS